MHLLVQDWQTQAAYRDHNLRTVEFQKGLKSYNEDTSKLAE